MTALVSVETVLLVILLVLVAGLLRSHAELLRRLGPVGEGATPPAGVRPPAEGGAPRRPAPALEGVTPGGDPVALDFAHGAGQLTLLAFLTTGCSTCADFWETLAEPRLPAEVQTVIVAHGRDRERPSRVAGMAPERVPVVMSSQAWSDYEVPGAPYFVLAGREILGEGVAGNWQALASLVSDALEEEREAAEGSGGSGAVRARRIDDTLAAGGIGPGHPSLHPGAPATQERV